MKKPALATACLLLLAACGGEASPAPVMEESPTSEGSTQEQPTPTATPTASETATTTTAPPTASETATTTTAPPPGWEAAFPITMEMKRDGWTWAITYHSAPVVTGFEKTYQDRTAGGDHPPGIAQIGTTWWFPVDENGDQAGVVYEYVNLDEGRTPPDEDSAFGLMRYFSVLSEPDEDGYVEYGHDFVSEYVDQAYSDERRYLPVSWGEITDEAEIDASIAEQTALLPGQTLLLGVDALPTDCTFRLWPDGSWEWFDRGEEWEEPGGIQCLRVYRD